MSYGCAILYNSKENHWISKCDKERVFLEHFFIYSFFFIKIPLTCPVEVNFRAIAERRKENRRRRWDIHTIIRTIQLV